MSGIYESRFFVTSDERAEYVFYRLPYHWWSRFYEYRVLDADCGIGHPFKFYLADHCQEVYACDLDPRILDSQAIMQEVTAFNREAGTQLDQDYFDKLNLTQANLTHLPYESNIFDKVFCISILEHMDEESMVKTFEEFSRILKDEGLLILTFDYPDIQFSILTKAMQKTGLDFYGDVSFDLPSNAVYSQFHAPFLYCYRAVLRKK